MSAEPTTTRADEWVERLLACPRDRGALRAEGDELVCAEGHRYPFVDGIPVLVVDDAEPTQPGYWSRPEQIEAALATERERGEAPAGDAVDPYVAELIVGTHGNLYRQLAKGLPRYPIPEFPLPRGKGELLLDIGCNWGRWTVSAQRAGYDAVGIDPSFEAVVAARRIARQLGAPVRYVVADARFLPFPDATFDRVFAYSVLQHFSKTDAVVSAGEIGRVLKRGGMSSVQMPNAFGLLNLARLAQRRFRKGEAFEVRYWRPSELRRAFSAIGPTKLLTDGFFTLNPQTSDLDLLPRAYRPIVRASAALKRASARLPFLTTFADSVNVRSGPR